jgi:hypothetical protein
MVLERYPGFTSSSNIFLACSITLNMVLYSKRTEFLLIENRERSELLKMLDSPMLSRNRLWQNADERPRSDTSFRL